MPRRRNITAITDSWRTPPSSSVLYAMMGGASPGAPNRRLNFFGACSGGQSCILCAIYVAVFFACRSSNEIRCICWRNFVRHRCDIGPGTPEPSFLRCFYRRIRWWRRTDSSDPPSSPSGVLLHEGGQLLGQTGLQTWGRRRVPGICRGISPPCSSATGVGSERQPDPGSSPMLPFTSPAKTRDHRLAVIHWTERFN